MSFMLDAVMLILNHVVKEDLSLDSFEMESDGIGVAYSSSYINGHLGHVDEELEFFHSV